MMVSNFSIKNILETMMGFKFGISSSKRPMFSFHVSFWNFKLQFTVDLQTGRLEIITVTIPRHPKNLLKKIPQDPPKTYLKHLGG